MNANPPNFTQETNTILHFIIQINSPSFDVQYYNFHLVNIAKIVSISLFVHIA